MSERKIIRCAWCLEPMKYKKGNKRYCSVAHKNQAYRFRRDHQDQEVSISRRVKVNGRMIWLPVTLPELPKKKAG